MTPNFPLSLSLSLSLRIAMHQERKNKHKQPDSSQDNAVPAYLLDRETQTTAKVLSNTVKQKRKEKAGKWDVPLPKVRGISEEEVFKPIKSGKSKSMYSVLIHCRYCFYLSS